MQQISFKENNVIEVINAENEVYTGYINYNSTRQCWTLDLVSEKFKIYGIKITSFPNILQQWSKKLGFGIGVMCENKSEPFFWEDFNTGRAKMYLLEPDDLKFQELLYARIK